MSPVLPWYTQFYQRGHLLVLSLVLILVSGASSLFSLPRLEDPRIDTRNALIITPYPGASAERVEALVTDVLEDKLREMFEIKKVESTSRANISVISIEFQDWVTNANNEPLFSKVRNVLSEASAAFPAGAGSPVLDEKRGATAFTLLIAVKPVHDSHDLLLTARFADELADRLRNVPGTELVRIYGAPQEELSVMVSPEQLASSGLTLAQISQQIVASDPKIPSGTLHADGFDLRLTLAQPLESLESLQTLVVKNDAGAYMRLGDIATITRSEKTPVAERTFVDAEPVIIVAARMQVTVRVDRWTQAAREALAKFSASFGGSVSADIVFEQNRYTEARLADLSNNLLMGSLVVMAVIFIFMGFRAAWVVGLALPLCAAFALFSLSFFDQQIHQMSIFGIIIAIGLLIDNAIVITDEIRINLKDLALSRVQAMHKSVKHLFAPLFASTLTTILGFMPIFLLNGNIGDFIGPIAISVVMALIGSLVISLTLIAALAARFLPREDSDRLPWWQAGVHIPALSEGFRVWLTGVMAKPWWVLLFIVAFCLSGFIAAGRLANVFFPSADRDQFEVYVWANDGGSIARTEKLALRVDDYIRQQPGVTQVSWLVGGSAPSVYYNQVMRRDNQANFANAVVTTDEPQRARVLIGRLQKDLTEQFPDAQVVVRAFGQGPPIPAPVEVDIFGPDVTVLSDLGEQVRHIMSEIPGLSQSIASITRSEPELWLDTSSDATSLAGLTLNDVANQLQTNLSGRVGGSVLESTEELPVRVRVLDSQSGNVASLQGLPIMATSDAINGVPLAALGELRLHAVLSGITRKNGERLNRVQAFLLPDIPAVDVSRQIKQRLDEGAIQLPEGYRIQMAGDADEQAQALGKLATYAPILLVMMITTLILTFHSLRMAMVIGSVALLSVGLGMFSLWLSGLPVGFNPLLGSAGLIGVAINGSIVVIAAINANAQAKTGDITEIVNETLGCSRHILSTTITTVGGLIPLLLFSSGTFWPPLAVVLAGGVGFSIILSLVFTPLIVCVLQRWRYRKQHRLA